MKKKSCILVGYGYWGKKIYPSLISHFNVKKIFRSSDRMQDIFFENIDWAFIITPEKTHYNLVSFFLKKKINVFCEKPLTLSYYSAKKLVQLSKKFKVKLYISDIEIYKNIKIKIYKNNFISRKKKANFDLNQLPEKLIYHDLYLLYAYLKSKNIRFGQFNIFSKKLTFNIESNNKNFHFNYDISSKKLLHKINDSNFISKKNFINYMFSKLTNNRSNFDANHKRSLFALKLMEYIKKRICLKK